MPFETHGSHGVPGTSLFLRSGTFTPSTVTPPRLLIWALMAPAVSVHFFLGLAFKLPKRLDLISWVGMIQLGSISRPKHLPGHQDSLQESTGVLGMTFAVDAAW